MRCLSCRRIICIIGGMASQIVKEYERGNISKVNGLFVTPAVRSYIGGPEQAITHPKI